MYDLKGTFTIYFLKISIIYESYSKMKKIGPKWFANELGIDLRTGGDIDMKLGRFRPCSRLILTA